MAKDSDDRALKRAYRKLSLKYHPDKVKGKEEEKDCSKTHFFAITKAYETLRCICMCGCVGVWVYNSRR